MRLLRVLGILGIAISILILTFGVNRIGAAPIILKADADTSLVQEAPGNNFGGNGRLYVGVTDGNDSAALLRFDLSDLAPTGRIVYAVLKLNLASGLLGGSFELRRVLKPWGEGSKIGAPASSGEATWLSAKSSELPWTTAGGGIGTDFSSTFSANPESDFLSRLWFLPGTMIDEIQEWRENPQNNFGWVIKRNLCCGQSTTRTSFVSSESLDQGPELWLHFGDPDAPRVLTGSCSTTRCGYFPELIGADGITISDEGLNVIIEPAFPNGSIFYTLDGSEPTASSPRYTNALLVSSDVVLRALNYSSDFSQSGQTPPIPFQVRQAYSITAATSGGGTVYVLGDKAPQSEKFFEGTVVRTLAVPGSGYRFLRWEGDVADPFVADTSTVADTNKHLVAVFGVPLTRTIQGQGALVTDPATGPYRVGSVLRVTPLPAEGHYFAQWGGTAGGNPLSGNATPLALNVIGPINLAALFLPLQPNQATLTVRAEGGGRVERDSNKNVYSAGETVVLTAQPIPGFRFIGWSGDASGNDNPLSLTLTGGSRTVTALFEGRLEVSASPSATGITLGFNPEAGFNYVIQHSSDLLNWTHLQTISDTSGPVETTFSTRRQEKEFYRVLIEPTGSPSALHIQSSN